jgi:DNA-binding NtrC family response regulator
MATSDPGNGAPKSRGHILVVDDDETWGAAAGRILSAAGFSVRVAPDYRVALEVLESAEPVDLLLTDIVMPERVNGVALGRMARMRRRNLRLLYMTAYDIPRIGDEIDDIILKKPISDESLVLQVERTLAAAT